MRIQQIQTFNSYNNTNFQNKSAKAPSFEGGLADWVAKNYFEKFYRSKFAKHFVEKTSSPKWDNMTTHMSVLGSTLISSMYVIRTLENDKLDEKKRKTLAINDVLTWIIATGSTYLADAKLSNWWDGVTTRFSANYLLDNKNAKRVRSISDGEWDPADIKTKMQDWYKYYNTRIDKINESMDERNKIVLEKQLKAYEERMQAENKPFNRDAAIKELEESGEYKARVKLERVKETAYKNIRDFNLDVLKNRKLTTFIDGMGVLKSLFIFGMIYRYVVPVLVMKPANYIGRKYHEKNELKKQQENQQVK